MKQVLFTLGSSESYNLSEHENHIYFTTDTNDIILDDIVYTESPQWNKSLGYKFVNGDGVTTLTIDDIEYTLNPGEELKGTFVNDIAVTKPYYLKEVYINGNTSVSIYENGTSPNQTLEVLEVHFSKDYERSFYNGFRYNNALHTAIIKGGIATSVAQMISYNNCEFVSLDIDTSKCTEFNAAFRQCPNLRSLDLHNWDTTNCTVINAFARDSELLDTVRFGDKWDLANCTNTTNAFLNCPSLEIIVGNIHNIPDDLNFIDSPLTRDSALVIINGLMDYSNGESHTMSFSDYTKSLLTADDIKLATDKNWII